MTLQGVNCDGIVQERVASFSESSVLATLQSYDKLNDSEEFDEF